MPPIQFDGLSFGPEEIEALRKNLIQLRDEALLQAHFDWAVILSHTLVILAIVAERMKEATP